MPGQPELRDQAGPRPPPPAPTASDPAARSTDADTEFRHQLRRGRFRQPHLPRRTLRPCRKPALPRRTGQLFPGDLADSVRSLLRRPLPAVDDQLLAAASAPDREHSAPSAFIRARTPAPCHERQPRSTLRLQRLANQQRTNSELSAQPRGDNVYGWLPPPIEPATEGACCGCHGLAPEWQIISKRRLNKNHRVTACAASPACAPRARRSCRTSRCTRGCPSRRRPCGT